MSTDSSRMTDAVQIAVAMARELPLSGLGIVGYGIIEHRDEHGHLIEARPFANLITNNGDTYYAHQAIVGVTPAAVTAPTLVSRMKLGTGTTAPNKAAGTNENIQTYPTGITATKAFDATYPQKTTGSANGGALAIYKTTWNAGEATNSALTEATISTDTTDTADVAGECISRVVFSAVNKGASDTLAITWNHKFLGA
jgi:hypothetical protein